LIDLKDNNKHVQFYIIYFLEHFPDDIKNKVTKLLEFFEDLSMIENQKILIKTFHKLF